MAARAFVRPHDVRLSSHEPERRRGRGADRPDLDARLAVAGDAALDDGQVLVAELPNDDLVDLTVGSTVSVDLRRAKAFEAPEPVGAPSE